MRQSRRDAGQNVWRSRDVSPCRRRLLRLPSEYRAATLFAIYTYLPAADHGFILASEEAVIQYRNFRQYFKIIVSTSALGPGRRPRNGKRRCSRADSWVPVSLRTLFTSSDGFQVLLSGTCSLFLRLYKIALETICCLSRPNWQKRPREPIIG